LWPGGPVPLARGQSIDMPHRQELVLPEITPAMAGQPVDIPVVFEQPCYAADTARHAVRVFYDEGSGAMEELACQIYDLEHSDSTHISACKLVFLLRGPGTYTLAYSSQETEPPDYTDHVEVGEGSYYYEPVPGYSIDLDYYSISDDGNVVYGVGQQGDFFGIDMAQKIIKQLPGSQRFEVQNWGQLASYAFFWHEDRDKGTDEQLVSKQIVVDGPLMARVGIESASDDGKATTTAYYTYYHSPGSQKRLMASVEHRVNEPCQIRGLTNEDGVYAYLLTVRARSSSIDRLNLGDIPPYLHVSVEDGTVHEYMLDRNPESSDYKWLLDTRDDIDIGSPAWYSIDNGDSGTAYALLFNTTSPASSLPGMQVRAVGRQEVSVPGLEVDGGGISSGRNAYERGGSHNLSIPAGFTARFTSEFYATREDGVAAVKREVSVFQALEDCRICTAGEITGGGGQRHRLTVTTHLAPSIPLAPALSLLTGRNLPATSVELWRNGSLLSSSVASRLPLDIDAPLGVDLRNSTLFKTAVFPRVPAGRYTIRVKGGLDGQRYIGARPVTISGDTTARILCRLEGSLAVAMHDQDGRGIPDVDVSLLSSGATIAANTTGSDGGARLTAPMPASYILQARYKGFILHQQELRLPHRGGITAAAELHDLDVIVTDGLGMAPGVTLQPVLTSSQMDTPVLLQADSGGSGRYRYEKLPAGPYTLRIRYKSYTLEQAIEIPARAVHVTFPAAYPLHVTCRDSRGLPRDCGIQITRQGKSIEADMLPPGRYHVTATSRGDVIGERDIYVTGDTSIIMVTDRQPLYPLLGTAAVILAAGVLLYLMRRWLTMQHVLLVAAIALLLIAPLHAWWQLDGSQGATTVETHVYLLPAGMVTVGHAPGYTGGSVADLPGLFYTMGTAVAGLVVLAAGLLAAYWLYRRAWLPLLAAIAAVAAVATFTLGMSLASEVIAGELWGSGTVAISLPGLDGGGSVDARWSPAIGFWLAVLGTAALLAALRGHIAAMLGWLRRHIPTF
ncbi:MAG: carboxypeptidase-like regulatory domain-containing protein, partial [Thermoplasmatota archaeon]